MSKKLASFRGAKRTRNYRLGITDGRRTVREARPIIPDHPADVRNDEETCVFPGREANPELSSGHNGRPANGTRGSAQHSGSSCGCPERRRLKAGTGDFRRPTTQLTLTLPPLCGEPLPLPLAGEGLSSLPSRRRERVGVRAASLPSPRSAPPVPACSAPVSSAACRASSRRGRPCPCRDWPRTGRRPSSRRRSRLPRA